MTTTDRSLNELCELLIDSKLGYSDASRRADAPRLKQLLARIGESRTGMIAILSNTMERSGHSVPNNGTFKGTAHRIWMAIRDFLSSTDDVNMVAECERGESYLIGRYDACMKETALTGDVRSLLAGQRADLMTNMTEIRSMDLTLSEAS